MRNKLFNLTLVMTLVSAMMVAVWTGSGRKNTQDRHPKGAGQP
jgi:hypothetical protein